ncbi:sodium:calcium antiporter [Chlorobium ferrooxidans]|uniref:K+-dependent Na+/Ca+ exchanger related-protein n=1 Tax=Chlorobium ferrooxidans DSM 13031 TaxID=377431 RepID=Q0YP53_9CHLB|nr:sodium:calcium antiporter [Chlorobium ferrooxidans]EAT58079.1 K+-dependent Na+/Ca+ exchanger related-protein [Chlorobium ferrooxidans DSM 13031]
MNEYAYLLFGILFAALGGDLFVRGAVGIASSFRIAPGIIGATVAAFATSTPELSVAVNAGIAGSPQIAMGDALGSNIVNIAFILGIVLAISGIDAPQDTIRRDYTVALLVPVITGILLLDGLVSRLDGFLMVSIFLFWFLAVFAEARKQRRKNAEIPEKNKKWASVLLAVAGLILLVTSGKLIVSGATAIALAFGMDKFLIGATVVALGTSMPELASSLIAKYRGHDEVGLGTILGSNIFNGLLIVGVTAMINPIQVTLRETGTALLIGITALLLTFPLSDGRIKKSQGVFLIMLYAGYLIFCFAESLKITGVINNFK